MLFTWDRSAPCEQRPGCHQAVVHSGQWLFTRGGVSPCEQQPDSRRAVIGVNRAGKAGDLARTMSRRGTIRGPKRAEAGKRDIS
jgi:hypothetical protein